MRVICIDAKPRKYTNGIMDISEGEIYEVEKTLLSNMGNMMHLLVGHYDYTNYGERIGYAADRFIPLSNIDELQLTNSKEEYA